MNKRTETERILERCNKYLEMGVHGIVDSDRYNSVADLTCAVSEVLALINTAVEALEKIGGDDSHLTENQAWRIANAALTTYELWRK